MRRFGARKLEGEDARLPKLQSLPISAEPPLKPRLKLAQFIKHGGAALDALVEQVDDHVLVGGVVALVVAPVRDLYDGDF